MTKNWKKLNNIIEHINDKKTAKSSFQVMDLDTAFKNSTLLADLVSDIVLMQNTWKVSSHGPAQTKKSESIKIENRTQRTYEKL